MSGLGLEPAFRRGLGLGKFRLRLIKQEQALLRYVIGFMACVGFAYFAGLVCDAWPFLQLQLQRPPPLSAHARTPPPRTRPYHWGGGGWERQTPDHI